MRSWNTDSSGVSREQAPPARSPARRIRLCAALCVLATALTVPRAAGSDPWPDIPIPPQNAATLRSPAPRPPPGDVNSRVEHLVAALNSGDASAAEDFFLPRAPFLAIKDISGAAGYFNTLMRWYRRDIETYRAQLPAGAQASLVSFTPSTRCTWMALQHEGNRLPYWSCYGSQLVLSANGREYHFRVNVMINWGDQWYVTHLGPIPHNH